MSVPAPELTSDVSGSNQVDLQDDHIQSTGSDSPASAAEQQLLDNKESSRPHNLDNYADIGLVHDNRMSYTPSESQQQQDSHDMPGFSVSVFFLFYKTFWLSNEIPYNVVLKLLSPTRGLCLTHDLSCHGL